MLSEKPWEVGAGVLRSYQIRNYMQCPEIHHVCPPGHKHNIATNQTRTSHHRQTLLHPPSQILMRGPLPQTQEAPGAIAPDVCVVAVMVVNL